MKFLVLFVLLSTCCACKLEFDCVKCVESGCFYLEFADSSICLKSAFSLEGLMMFVSPFQDEFCWKDSSWSRPPPQSAPEPPPSKSEKSHSSHLASEKLPSHLFSVPTNHFKSPPPFKSEKRRQLTSSPPPLQPKMSHSSQIASPVQPQPATTVSEPPPPPPFISEKPPLQSPPPPKNHHLWLWICIPIILLLLLIGVLVFFGQKRKHVPLIEDVYHSLP